MSVALEPAPYAEIAVDYEESVASWKKELGAELKTLRKAVTDKTQEKFAESIGWTPGKLGSVERGETGNINLYIELALIHGVEFDELTRSAGYGYRRRVQRSSSLPPSEEKK